MKAIISVIVPIYMAEKSIERCINSILNQTFINFELILVNDGSTDNSKEICEKYAIRDKRIKVINKKNEGVSIARNTGINEAKGEYVLFVDSDDYIEKDMLEHLYNNIIVCNAQVSICKMNIYKDNVLTSVNTNEKNIVIYKNEEIIKEFILKNTFLFSVSNKLYKISLFKDNNIRFSEAIRYGEDAILNHHILSKCEVVVYSNEAKYNYFIDSNSTVTNINEKRLDILIGIKEIFKLIKLNYPQYENVITRNFVGAIIAIIIDITAENSVIKKMYIIKSIKKILKDSKCMLKDMSLVPLKYKIFLNIIKINPLIVVFFYKLRFMFLKKGEIYEN